MNYYLLSTWDVGHVRSVGSLVVGFVFRVYIHVVLVIKNWKFISMREKIDGTFGV